MEDIDFLPTHKAPSVNDSLAEYYKHFKTLLTPHLTDLFNHISRTGTFPVEMLQAMITAVPKPGKDMTSPTNFHPISLLNADIEIYAKSLVRRLFRYLPQLIESDQVGFVEDRQAPDGTRRLIHLLHKMGELTEPSLLLSLDAEKVFDRVHWLYLQSTLRKFSIMG